jgi:hypothetical protein
VQANPDFANARSVAAIDGATLYATSTPDGGYCSELVVADSPRGVTCVPASRLAEQPVSVTVPLVGDGEQVVMGGRMNAAGATVLMVVYADGSQQPASVGTDGYWIMAIEASHRDSALANGVLVRALDSGGATVAEVQVPPLADDGGAGALLAPISVNTISNGDDLTLVLGVDGRVQVPGVATLELVFPDGTTVPIALAPGGSYSYTFPVDAQDDLRSAPATLIARDAAGTEVRLLAGPGALIERFIDRSRVTRPCNGRCGG